MGMITVCLSETIQAGDTTVRVHRHNGGDATLHVQDDEVDFDGVTLRYRYAHDETDGVVYVDRAARYWPARAVGAGTKTTVFLLTDKREFQAVERHVREKLRSVRVVEKGLCGEAVYRVGERELPVENLPPVSRPSGDRLHVSFAVDTARRVVFAQFGPASLLDDAITPTGMPSSIEPDVADSEREDIVERLHEVLTARLK